jgi:hypothetical protein
VACGKIKEEEEEEKFEYEHFNHIQYLRIFGSFKLQKLGTQIANMKIAKNMGSANRKSANCHISGRSANLSNLVSPE